MGFAHEPAGSRRSPPSPLGRIRSDVRDRPQRAGRFEESLEASRKLVALEPENAYAYALLGSAYFANGQLDEAIRANRAAMERAEEPGAVREQAEIGLWLLLAGQPQAALPEHERYLLNAEQPDFYCVLWHVLTLDRLGRLESARTLLRDSVRDLDLNSWEESLLACQLDELWAPELLSRASEPGELCEAHFYTGYQPLLRGDPSAAVQSFRDVLAVEMFHYYEHTSAAFLLARLQASEG